MNKTITDLEKYRTLLDTGSYEGLRYSDPLKSRFESFKYCLEFLEKRTENEILELGTSRSFVDGKFEGCNSDDSKYWNPNDFSKWDWGAGCFTIIFGLMCNQDSLTTVDLIQNHLTRCKTMTDSLNIRCNHINSDSIRYLERINKKFDLIYLDTGDMWPIEPTINLQLREVETIVSKNLLKEDGIILIDDVLNGTPKDMGDLNNKLGKSEKAIPYLIDNGYKIIFEGYQYILKK
jgi:hypothetical protein